MSKGKPQSSVAAHRNPAHRSSLAVHAHPVFLFNVWQEFPQEKVAIALPAIGGIDVETAEALRSDDQEIADLLLAAEVINQRPSAGLEKGLLVVAEAMQEVDHGISIGRARALGIIARRQMDAVPYRAAKHSALDDAAVDAVLRERK